MKKLTIADAQTIILGLQDEIRRSEDSRYDHRLHGVLLVAHGMSCREVAGLLGDAPRTVQNWINRFEEKGLSGIVESERSGRPRRLDEEQLEEINMALRRFPEAVGMTGNLWDGKMLSAFIKKEYGVDLGVRQCQYLFRNLGFRFRKPRPMVAHADPIAQEQYKKTQKMER